MGRRGGARVPSSPRWASCSVPCATGRRARCLSSVSLLTDGPTDRESAGLRRPPICARSPLCHSACPRQLARAWFSSPQAASSPGDALSFPRRVCRRTNPREQVVPALPSSRRPQRPSYARGWAWSLRTRLADLTAFLPRGLAGAPGSHGWSSATWMHLLFSNFVLSSPEDTLAFILR